MSARNRMLSEDFKRLMTLSQENMSEKEFYLPDDLNLHFNAFVEGGSRVLTLMIPAGTQVIHFARSTRMADDDDGWQGARNEGGPRTIMSFFIDAQRGVIVSVMSSGCLRFSPEYRRTFLRELKIGVS